MIHRRNLLHCDWLDSVFPHFRTWYSELRMHIATTISLAALLSAVAIIATSVEARSAPGCPGIWGNDKTDKGLAVVPYVTGIWVPDGEKV
jgi:hypothetical protein